MPHRPSHALALALVTLCLLAALPATGQAQEKVYAPGELTELPRLADNAQAARVLGRTNPGRSGRVQLKLVVNPDGRVDPASIEVVAASDDSLVEAATRAVRELEFVPGKKDGSPVRSMVLFPVRYAG